MILPKDRALIGQRKVNSLRPFVPKGKDPDYYHKIRRGLGYVSMLVSSDSESEEVYHDNSSATSSWDSDVVSRVSSRVSQ